LYCEVDGFFPFAGFTKGAVEGGTITFKDEVNGASCGLRGDIGNVRDVVVALRGEMAELGSDSLFVCVVDVIWDILLVCTGKIAKGLDGASFFDSAFRGTVGKSNIGPMSFKGIDGRASG